MTPATDHPETIESGPQTNETPAASEAQTEEVSSLAAIEAELAQSVDARDEPGDEIPSLVPAWHGEFPDVLMRIVDGRIGVWQKLADMDKQRRELQDQAVARVVRDELSRQTRELKRVPDAPMLDKTLATLRKKLRDPEPKVESSPRDPKAKHPPPNQTELYREALSLGLIQASLLKSRAKFDLAIPQAALAAAHAEPLLEVCRRHDVGGDPLIGWVYYALGVLKRLEHCREQQREHRDQVAQNKADDKKAPKGLRAVFGGASKQPDVPPLDPAVTRTLDAARRELQAIEPHLTELFWSLYEDLGWLLARNELDERSEPVVRAFLRYGLVVAHPGLIEPEVLDYIMKDCREDVYNWENTPTGTHAVYADEYIYGVTHGKVTVSPDEDLELNERGGEIWRADRVWRQAVISKIRSQLVEARQEQLGAEIAKLEQRTEELQAKLEKIKNKPSKKAKREELEIQLATIRPELGRLRNGTESIDKRVLPGLHHTMEEALQKLADEARVLTRERVARREARFIRRMARLTARLKEPFPQFSLREHFVPGRGDHHSRQALEETVAWLEKADGRIFQHVLVPNKRLDRRISVRMSPTFLIAPTRGQMGFAIAHRKWDDNGRFVLPLIGQRQNVLDDTLIDLLADFRWDCSKEEAGMDWITADALCSGYAATRWNARKLPDKALKSMGLDLTLKDRANWRVHYRLFVTSAEEQGRMLFSKSDEVYRLVVKHIGLPPGVEVLKRD